MSEPTLYRKAKPGEIGGILDVVPVEPTPIRWCITHRRETWAGRTTCVGMGGQLDNACQVVPATLMIGGNDE